MNGVAVFDTVIGVIDHDTFITDNGVTRQYTHTARTGTGGMAIVVGCSGQLGGPNFLFIEDNTFTQPKRYQGSTHL